MNLDEWMIAAQQGTPNAVEGLAKEAYKKAFPIAFKILRNREDAEEVANDCGMKVFVNWRTWERLSNLDTWMSRIAVNCALDQLRRKKKRTGDRSISEMQDAGTELPVDPPDYAGSIDKQRQIKRLHQCLEKLPPNFREAISLKGLEEMSLEEMCNKLGGERVKNWYYRGLNELRKCLKSEKTDTPAASKKEKA